MKKTIHTILFILWVALLVTIEWRVFDHIHAQHVSGNKTVELPVEYTPVNHSDPGKLIASFTRPEDTNYLYLTGTECNVFLTLTNHVYCQMNGGSIIMLVNHDQWTDICSNFSRLLVTNNIQFCR